MPKRISVNNLRIADFDIFWELINNDQRATTTLLPVGIENSCSLKNFSDTKFVYRIFKRNLLLAIWFTKSVLLIAVLTVSP